MKTTINKLYAALLVLAFVALPGNATAAETHMLARFSIGQSIANSLSDSKSAAWDMAFILPSGYTVGYLNEGHKQGDYGKRDGFYIQRRSTYSFSNNVELSAAYGLYVADTTAADSTKLGYRDKYSLNGLMSLAADYQVTKSLKIGGVFHRIVFSNNLDADVFMVSLTWK